MLIPIVIFLGAKTYKVISPDLCSVQMKNAKATILALSYRNGVVFEQKGQYGISFLLDQMLYEYLSDQFPEIQIKTTTYYDYSEFLFFFDHDLRSVPVQALYDAFANAPIRSDPAFCDYRAATVCKGPKNDPESMLQKCCYDNERYLFAISGIREEVKQLSQKDVANWYQKYVCESRIQMILSPCSQKAEVSPPVFPPTFIFSVNSCPLRH